VLGLYTGGTLAHEAHLILEPLLGSIVHRIVDLTTTSTPAGGRIR
jgi:hypothetical protein